MNFIQFPILVGSIDLSKYDAISHTMPKKIWCMMLDSCKRIFWMTQWAKEMDSSVRYGWIVWEMNGCVAVISGISGVPQYIIQYIYICICIQEEQLNTIVYEPNDRERPYTARTHYTVYFTTLLTIVFIDH